MKKIISLFLLLTLICPASAFATEAKYATIVPEPNQPAGVIKLTVSSKKKLAGEKPFLKNSWQSIKGQPSDNAVNLGMFSYHTREDRDQLNESNKLIGLDYNGYCAGTYNNSFHKQTYYAGITRKVYEKELPEGVNMDFKYRLMALYGYKKFEFNVGGITPIIVPMVGFSKGPLGVDFLISPGRTLTFATNFRINLDNN